MRYIRVVEALTLDILAPACSSAQLAGSYISPKNHRKTPEKPASKRYKSPKDPCKACASPKDHPRWGTAAIRAFDGEAPHGHRAAPGSFGPG